MTVSISLISELIVAGFVLGLVLGLCTSTFYYEGYQQGYQPTRGICKGHGLPEQGPAYKPIKEERERITVSILKNTEEIREN